MSTQGRQRSTSSKVSRLDRAINHTEDAQKFGEDTGAGWICDPASMPPNEVVDGAMGR